MADWLVIDVGNSRIKWATGRPGCWHDTGASPLIDAAGLAAPAAGRGLPAAALNVAGAAGESLLQAWERALGRPIRRLLSPARGGGVISAYERPELLGIDRYAALVGARQRSRANCLVVCAGSALTVDWLHADGRHGGGLILPGRRLMRLAMATFAGVGETPEDPSWPPVSTPAAVTAGVAYALAGATERAWETFTVSAGLPAQCFLTGGDAPWLMEHLHITAAEHLPDLIFDGLVTLAEETHT